MIREADESSIYVIRCGEDPPTEFAGMSDAMDAMQETIINCRLPKWREQALIGQLANMPRAGFSFTDRSGQLIEIKKVK